MGSTQGKRGSPGGDSGHQRRQVRASSRYRGRFAPSPTGPLHFGSLLAALASYCDARSRGGEWLLRIEDVDLPRSRAGAAEAIAETLASYGFAWDGPIVRQSERSALYADALDRLRARGLLFACACTRRELEAAPPGASGERIYPGTCRRSPVAAAEGRSWRVGVDDTPISFVDRLQGRQQQRLDRDVGDFVVRRADGLFAYQLAVVVDDALQGITDVVRGADLLASTPRQIWLQRQLGFATPAYLHHPIAVDRSGQKLSKESGAARLPDDPLPALCRAWRFLGQTVPDRPPRSLASFWRWAHVAWNARALPPVAMLPASADAMIQPFAR
ncbi:MAG TPA: tRNA glutamyl-Q(34) synthetase GluQRS [Casimicrobiaceae bacterium]